MSENENPEKENNLLDDILANALSSTKKYKETQTGLETKKCKNCGAARPADTNLQYCDYCNHQFY